MTRDKAYQLLTTYMQNKNLLKHCRAAEVAMKGLYKYLHKNDYSPEEEELWGIVGLLHDIDYEVAQKENKLDQHGILLFNEDKLDLPEKIAHAIKAHNYTMTKVDPETDLDWAIATVDGLTGFIVACALVRPNKKLDEVTVDAVIKKMGDKAFSRNVNRETIKMSEEQLGIPLDEFVKVTLTSTQEIHEELGL